MSLYVLTLILMLSPRLPDAQARPWAEAIAVTAADVQEARALTAIAFVETGFRARGVPFGVTCCRRPGMSLRDAATVAARIWRNARRQCGHPRSAFAYYNTGACRPNAYGDGQWARVERMRRRHPEVRAASR